MREEGHFTSFFLVILKRMDLGAREWEKEGFEFIRGGKQKWMRWTALMECGLQVVDGNGRRKMGSNRGGNSCSLCLCNEWRVYPIECTSLLHINRMEYLESLYRVPSIMFCSWHSYLLSFSEIVCAELLVCIPFGVWFVSCSLSTDRFPCLTVYTVEYISRCVLHFCISNPSRWRCRSCLWFLRVLMIALVAERGLV